MLNYVSGKTSNVEALNAVRKGKLGVVQLEELFTAQTWRQNFT